MTQHHCHAHPSREADLRCRVCARWLCDTCAEVHGLHVYCSTGCRRRDLLRAVARSVRRAALATVPAPWSVGVTAALGALLIAAVGVHVAELVEVAGSAPLPELTQPRPRSKVEGTLERSGREWVLRVSGTPHTEVLVATGGGTAAVASLDADGTALVRLGRGSTAPEVRLYPLSGGVTAVTATPTPAPTATVTPAPATTPTAIQAPPRPGAAAESRTATSPHPAPTPPPTRVPAPPDVHLIADAGPRLALTFDGSSAQAASSEVLDLLHKLGIHATLFVTGEYIEAAPELVRRALVEGHEVGNHTFSHPHLTTYAENHRQSLRPEITHDVFLSQLRRTEVAFYRATGRHMAPFWRAPYGEENATLRAWAAELGYLHVRWSSVRGASLDSRDWVEDEHSPLYEDAQRMMRRLLRFPELSGGIILMHLGSGREKPAWRVLPDLVAELRRRGIEPGTVSSLLGASPTWRGRLQRARARHAAAFTPGADH